MPIYVNKGTHATPVDTKGAPRDRSRMLGIKYGFDFT